MTNGIKLKNTEERKLWRAVFVARSHITRTAIRGIGGYPAELNSTECAQYADNAVELFRQRIKGA